MKVLILLKKNQGYGGGDYNTTTKSGLLNSATFLKNALIDLFKIHVHLAIVTDANDIDREVHHFKPNLVIIEAIWAPPYKMRELAKLHPKVIFNIRVHSKITFLSNEGMAIDWIKEYEQIRKHHHNLQISFNSKETYEDFREAGFPCFYLPNFYRPRKREDDIFIYNKAFTDPNGLQVGCFGAIRPMKNHLAQAIAAIQYANEEGKTLYFHVNSSRVEQRGEQALKNLEALFEGSNHQLVKWPWLTHEEFTALVSKMDLGMQVSLSESFNIISADFVAEGVPVIVSEEVGWLSFLNKVKTGSSTRMAEKISQIMKMKKLSVFIARSCLFLYNRKAFFAWAEYLKRFECE